MKLKKSVETLDGIDAKYHNLYEGDEDTGFTLIEIEIDDPGVKQQKQKLNEFRDSNRQLFAENKELKAIAAKFAGMKDMSEEQLESLLADAERAKAVADKKLIDEGKVDELIASRTAEMRKAHDLELKAKTKYIEELTGKEQTYKQQLAQLKIQSALADAVTAVGAPRKGALPDILARASGTWQVNEAGNLVAMKDGEQLFGPDSDPLTMQDYAKKLLAEAPHLFEAAKGGGGGGGGGEGGPAQPGVLRNPSKKDFGSNLEAIAAGKTRVERV